MNLSPTKVDTFLNCQRKFKYLYILKLKEPETKYFLLGNIAHRTLDLFHAQVYKNSDLPKNFWPVVMKESFIKAINEHHALDKIKEKIITKEDIYTTKMSLAQYLKRVQEKQAPEVYSLEKLFNIAIGHIQVWAKADRVDYYRDKDEVYIIDYKTGKWLPKREEMLESVQIPTYGVWIKNLIPNFKGKIFGVYMYLQYANNRDGANIFEITEEMMNKTTEKYIMVDSALNNNCSFEKNKGYKWCKNCYFKEKCKNE